ncbi:DUF4900 domain-containing protein [bacterium]|nr:DUF4900 domain-containing protein [bacterium]
MKTTKKNVIALRKDREGTILINTVFIVVLLVMSGFAFMRWAADEAFQADLELARTQAYYVAQHGIYQEGLPKLRKYKPGQLPEADIPFPTGEVYFDNKNIGNFNSTSLRRVRDVGQSDVFSQLYYFDLTATGTVPLTTAQPHRFKGSGFKGEVSRSVTMRAKLRSFANYMYLTDEELTEFNEIIWFYQEDTLWGRVHSNARIGIKNRPMFYGPVSTPFDDFEQGAGYNPWFAIEPQFNVPAIEFPEYATNLRAKATLYVSDDSGRRRTRLVGLDGTWRVMQWQAGTPYPDGGTQDPYSLFDDGPFLADFTWDYGTEQGIFIEGQADVCGNNIEGTLTIGTEGTMWLIDNVKYDGYEINEFSNFDTIPRAFPHMLGLVSEDEIVIKDTEANGRGNGDLHRANHDSCHIIITAAIIALDESFTFEHQNDIGDPYRWCDNPARGVDERGAIWLRGSVAQKRRGYVHRSNCGGTGYDKRYVYDFRFDDRPPPYILEAVDDRGNLLFDVVWWQQQDPHPDRP